MSMHRSFTEPLMRPSELTPELLEAYLREARMQRALVFSGILHSLGRAIARPFRRRHAEPRDVGGSGLATGTR